MLPENCAIQSALFCTRVRWSSISSLTLRDAVWRSRSTVMRWRRPIAQSIVHLEATPLNGLLAIPQLEHPLIEISPLRGRRHISRHVSKRGIIPLVRRCQHLSI